MAQMDYLKIYADGAGCSHFAEGNLALINTDYAPPAPAVALSQPQPARRCAFLEMPPGWWGEWHPSPVVQWITLLAGELEFEVGDGARRRCGAGDLVLITDTHGKGHQTRVVGDTPVRAMAVHL